MVEYLDEKDHGRLSKLDKLILRNKAIQEKKIDPPHVTMT